MSVKSGASVESGADAAGEEAICSVGADYDAGSGDGSGVCCVVAVESAASEAVGSSAYGALPCFGRCGIWSFTACCCQVMHPLPLRFMAGVVGLFWGCPLLTTTG